MITTYIYVLRDPRTNEVRYVGKTINPERRRMTHYAVCPSRHGQKRTVWVGELRAVGLRPIFEIIEECSESNWMDREEYWIAHYGLENLVNMIKDARDGSCRGARSVAVKEKLRQRSLVQWSNPCFRASQANIRKDWHRSLSPEAKEELSQKISKTLKQTYAITPNVAGPAAIKKHWDSLSTEERRELIRKRTTHKQFCQCSVCRVKRGAESVCPS